jgi:hypothetical protein
MGLKFANSMLNYPNFLFLQQIDIGNKKRITFTLIYSVFISNLAKSINNALYVYSIVKVFLKSYLKKKTSLRVFVLPVKRI